MITLLFLPIRHEELPIAHDSHITGFAEMVIICSGFEPCTERHVRLVWAHREPEHLVQGHVRHPHVTLGVYREAMR